jgi:hypothetical protein
MQTLNSLLVYWIYDGCDPGIKMKLTYMVMGGMAHQIEIKKYKVIHLHNLIKEIKRIAGN